MDANQLNANSRPTTSECHELAGNRINCEEKQVPLAVHRWFITGEGWAYHDAIDAKDLERVRAFATSMLANRAHVSEECGKREVEGDDKLWLVYRHYVDRNCPDPKARLRFPTVLIVALARGLNESEIEQLQKQLSSFRESDLPERPGLCPKLQLVVKRIEPARKEELQRVAETKPANPQLPRPSRPDLWPKFIAWCAPVLTLLVMVALICIEPFSLNFTYISENDPPSRTEQPPGKGHEHNADSAQRPKSSAPTTPSALSAQRSGKSNGNREPNTSLRPQPLQSRPPEWEIGAAERMLAHLKRWNKHKPLKDQLRIASPVSHIAELWDADLEGVSSDRAWSSIPLLTRNKTTTAQHEDLVIGRFFLVLSQEPVQHLLSDDVKKHTWQGKFIHCFPEKPAYAGASNRSWRPQSEQELRRWLKRLEDHFEKHQPGPKSPELPKTQDDSITVMVDRVALRIDYHAWKEAVAKLGGKKLSGAFQDCSDEVLARGVNDFQLPQSKPAQQ